MPSPFDQRDDMSPEDARELISELELAQAVDVQELRHRATTHVTGDVIVRPGNLADRSTIVARGTVRALHSSGITCVLDRPLLVGDVFHLALSGTSLTADAALVVCDRCALRDDMAIETHFRLPEPVDLRTSPDSGTKHAP